MKCYFLIDFILTRLCFFLIVEQFYCLQSSEQGNDVTWLAVKSKHAFIPATYT